MAKVYLRWLINMYHSWTGIIYIVPLVRSDLLDVCRTTNADRTSHIEKYTIQTACGDIKTSKSADCRPIIDRAVADCLLFSSQLK